MPGSSFVAVFNRNGGPSATAEFDSIKYTTRGAEAARHDNEVAEPIGQEILPFGHVPDKPRSTGAKTRVADVHPERAIGSPAPNLNEEVPTPATGGRDVLIEVRVMPSQGGRPRNKESYPFDTLNVAVKVAGQFEGETFLIPTDDRPEQRLAAARKRYAGKGFASRMEAGGMRVWRTR